MALDIGAGDEVITTPFTFFATAGVVARLGARPFFCDIDPATFNLDPAAVRTAIAERCELRGDRLVNRAPAESSKRCCPVHLYGQMADLDAFAEHRAQLSARRHRGRRAGDRCRARGRPARGQHRRHRLLVVLSRRRISARSATPACASRNDSALHERMRILRVHGGEPKYYHSLIGGNFRLDELQAAVLVIKLQAPR